MTQNIKYAITQTSITTENDVFVVFECYVDNVKLFDGAVTAVPGTPFEMLDEQISNCAHDTAMSMIETKEKEDAAKNEAQAKHAVATVLKKEIEKDIGKKKPVKKPKKKNKRS